MKLEQIIQTHPSLIYSEDMQTICKPLKLLNISYFGHGRIDAQGNVTGLSSDPNYLHSYLENKLFNSDLHAERGFVRLAYIHWDFIKWKKQNENYLQINQTFKLFHIFTLVKVVNQITNLYHFAVNNKNEKMNCFYVENIDLLESFIGYYHSKIEENARLKAAHNIYIPVKKLEANPNLEISLVPFLTLESKRLFLKSISQAGAHHLLSSQFHPSKRELECAKLLAEGMTIKLIAAQLNLSPRTIEIYVERLKAKLNCKNKAHLIKRLVEFHLIN